MTDCPDIVDGAKVIMFTEISDVHEYTGACKHTKAGKLIGAAQGLAITQYNDDPRF